MAKKKGVVGVLFGALLKSAKSDARKRPKGLPQGWKWSGDRRYGAKPRRRSR